MSDYQQYLQERDRIDYLYQKGYKITNIKEDLEGAQIEFQRAEEDKETLHILTAEGRKYFSVRVIQQN
ncbi:hypothetical protein EKG37_04270 [Robertmurraya yapensis]|uniref:Uncharacterized protein n=2 Tax=Bacillaceae TaxID=186817 RepID=A0A431WJT2_9BACI|nr:hypothetical protein [Bacillus yapensis]RTR35851.1 hypothetical protein EKG37_04270 [Bacillus yapensis]TKS98653.1 hypothetical protein FAR12_04270 [Bacillus yapensis]